MTRLSRPELALSPKEAAVSSVLLAATGSSG
jgi:hypothetical protein